MAVRTTSAADNELAPGESNVELLLTDVLWRGVEWAAAGGELIGN